MSQRIKIERPYEGLEFNYKKTVVRGYCSNNFTNSGLVTYRDDSKRTGAEFFRGNNFKIYDEKFNVLTTRIDLNEWKPIDGKKVRPTTDDFVNRLKEMYIIAKRLNPEVSMRDYFHKTLPHILEYSNYTFNSDYISKELLPDWDSIDSDASEYIKQRDWQCKMSPDVTVKDKYHFLSLLAEDRVLKRQITTLGKLLPLIDSNSYIDLKSIGIDRKRGNKLVWDIVDKYNIQFIQCPTKKSYDNLIKIAEYLEEVFESDEKVGTVYNGIYRVTNILANHKLPSVNEIYSNVLVGEKSVRKFKSFTIDSEAEKSKDEVRFIIEYLLSNRDKVSFERVKKSQKEDSKSTIEANYSITIDDIITKTDSEQIDYFKASKNSCLKASTSTTLDLLI
jgi:hypothetical protein